MEVKAYAKINLGLDVVRRLENGYHEVRMIMQSVDLYDTLIFQKIESGICIHVDGSDVPKDESNLVYKAAKLMMDMYHIPGGVDISLKKRIPVAAGMAGGSTDAAATFRGMNKLYNLQISTEKLMEIGVKIGADVPYCILGGTALSEGIGELLTPLSPPPFCYLLIAKPDLSVSTAFVYQNLHVEKIEKHPNIYGLKEALEEGNLKEMTSYMENILETVTIKEFPVIQEIKEKMKEYGAMKALMSGSGPTVFGLFEDKETLEKAYAALKETGIAKDLFQTQWGGENI